MVSAWRNFKNIFSRQLFTIILRPEMLKFHPYSILTGDTMVGFVIFCVLNLTDDNHQYEMECQYLYIMNCLVLNDKLCVLYLPSVTIVNSWIMSVLFWIFTILLAILAELLKTLVCFERDFVRYSKNCLLRIAFLIKNLHSGLQCFQDWWQWQHCCFQLLPILDNKRIYFDMI